VSLAQSKGRGAGGRTPRRQRVSGVLQLGDRRRLQRDPDPDADDYADAWDRMAPEFHCQARAIYFRPY
jgi:hypothetical protein